MKKKAYYPIEFPDDSLTSTVKNNQEKILLLLMYNPAMTFNELWNKEGRSNKFAYHLKVLERRKLVKKAGNGKYELTVDGKKQVAYIDEQNGKKCESPIVAVIALIIKDNKYLMLHRKKEPFHGYWGIHGGKLRSTNYILEQAYESVRKETGLKCDVELKGLFSSKSYVNKEFVYNHQLFIVKATNPRGSLLKETKKGHNKWVKKEDVKQLDILPNIPHLVKIATGKKFRWIEADRFKEGNSFSIDVKKDIVF